MSWSHRLVNERDKEGKVTGTGIFEVHFNERGEPFCYAKATLYASTSWGENTVMSLTEQVKSIKNALTQPVLNFPTDFVEPEPV